jgi:adenosylmethionine-8-amino-7-oxononanoate aminotransferase
MGIDSLWHPLTQHKTLKKNPPTHIVKTDGCYLVDQHGHRYLDAVAGIWCVNVGYGRTELADVAHKQMSTVPFLAPTMTHEPGILLANKLLELVGMAGHVYLSNSGSEANEAAFKIVWQYHAQSGEPGGFQRHKIISRYRAYHGNTLGGVSATGQAERKMSYGPTVPGFIHIPPPNPYRASEATPAEHGLACAKMLEETIIFEGPQTVAAFIMEPMISGGGALIPPDEYLPAIRDICDRYGVLLILDEVVSGFGRTGKMFGYEHWNVKPDIFTFAKGIASGYVPLAATLVKQEIFEAFLGEPGDLSHFRHINTYGMHPVSAAVGLRNIEIIEEENLSENSANMGQYMLEQLDDLVEHPYVGDVRGKGLLVGIELVADKETKTPLGGNKVGAVVNSCKEQQILVGRNGNTAPGLSNVILIAPPLIVTESEVDQIVSVVKNALNSILD